MYRINNRARSKNKFPSLLSPSNAKYAIESSDLLRFEANYLSKWKAVASVASFRENLTVEVADNVSFVTVIIIGNNNCKSGSIAA